MNFTRPLLRRFATIAQIYPGISSKSAKFIKERKVLSYLNTIKYYSIQHPRGLDSFHRNYSATVTDTKEDAYRNENNITVIGDNIPSPFTDIESSEFPEYIKQYLRKKAFEKPTFIQAQGWPIALSGQNFVGIAQTGTGKTLAYLLPAIVHIKEQAGRRGLGPRVLVLAPTRELARQIEEVAKDFENLLNIRTVCIYGGASRSVQASRLARGVDIVIATPGRLNDFLTSRTTNLSRCTYIVLDEADRMLDMGFEPQIRQALEGVPVERQILMWSATWPKEVKLLAKDYLGEFVQVNVGSTELSANHNITQHVHVCEPFEKMERFKKIMQTITAEEEHKKILVFANTKRFVDNLTFSLRNDGFRAEGLHGDKTQMQRDSIIYMFKSGRCNVLVATDVAARGLDVDGVSHVINYDFPNTSEDYIHRIGRTGRKDTKGTSHTFLTSDESRQARSLISVLKEANQEVPEELLQMSQSFSEGKAQERTNKYQQRSPFGRRNNYNSYNKSGSGYNNNRYGERNEYNRNSYNNRYGNDRYGNDRYGNDRYDNDNSNRYEDNDNDNDGYEDNSRKKYNKYEGKNDRY